MHATPPRTCVLIVLLPALGAAQSEPLVRIAPVALARAPIIDGVIGDDEWRGAMPSELQYQTQPGDNAPPSERTAFRVAYDREHLYVAIRAWDSERAGIRGRVTRRDNIFGDDYVTLHLDTYADQRRAYVFSFNPLGIQGDGFRRCHMLFAMRSS